MAAGLTIACSKRGPMPEVLEEGDVYSDPEDVDSIAVAVEPIVQDPTLRLRSVRCADELLEFSA